MGYWILSLIANTIIPIIITIAGFILVKRAPKKINGLVGYRTTMSMKNNDTWVFANHYFGKICTITGPVMFFLSLAATIFIYGKSDVTILYVTLAVVIIETLVLIASIVPTEKALKKTFDNDGRRKI
ncbi:hypothetical protein CCDG5_0077 [[Clostridium] cellulosi]|jgi:hypothetical protein|uniref:SdpI/YhfL protein family n=1 Tax=[Clostridium] cellulosi TaxID=29343 RepID=A0A078KL28_9FIRM|nr:hypothetical protein CCDG5_0077 [[Clostridium] cellulosi]